MNRFLFFTSRRRYALVVHLVVPTVLACIYLASALFNFYTFRTNTWDYGLFSTLLWNFSHGNGWYVPFYEGTIYANFLADHFTLMPIVLAPVFYLFPSPITLAVVQGCALAGVFFLAPLFVKEVYKSLGRDEYLSSALFLTLLLAVSRGFTAAADYQAHMTTIILPFILAALIALHRNALLWASVFCLLVALGQERSVVAVCGIGMYAFLLLRQYTFGLGLCAIASAYFLVIFKVLIPLQTQGGYKYTSAINPFWGLGLKANFLFKSLSGWIFLPAAGKKALLATLCALPVLALSLVSNRVPMLTFGHQYQDMPSIFLFAGATYGVAWFSGTRVFGRLPAKMVPLVCLAIIIGVGHGSRASLPLKNLVYGLPSQIENLNQTLKAFTTIHEQIAVYSQSGLSSRFAMRKNTFHLSEKTAGEPFKNAMIFISPLVSPYPESSANELTKRLLENPTVYPLVLNQDVGIFVTPDISRDKRR